MKKIYLNTSKNLPPNINLSIHRVEANVWYDMGFYKYHYLTSKLNKAAKCFLIKWGDTPIAFVALLNTPRKNHPYDMAFSRIVILPDFQGLGLSKLILNLFGGIVKSLGKDYRLCIKTIHTKIGSILNNSSNWKPSVTNRKTKNNVEYEKGKYNNRLKRASYCYIYCGRAIYGFEDLFLPIDILRKRKHVTFE